MTSIILQRHYLAAQRAEVLSAWWPDAEHRADKRAVDCAALHVGLDAMSRITRKRTPKHEGYAPIAPFPERFALPVVRLYDLLAAHASKAGEASHPGEATRVTDEHKAAARAFDVACHYRRQFRYWQG